MNHPVRLIGSTSEMIRLSMDSTITPKLVQFRLSNIDWSTTTTSEVLEFILSLLIGWHPHMILR